MTHYSINQVIALLSFVLFSFPVSQEIQAATPFQDISQLKALQSRVNAVVERVLPATVSIFSSSTGASGSGVIVNKDGLILTAGHVVRGSETITVVFPTGKQAQGKVLGANYTRDSAMIQITDPKPARGWPYADVGQSRDLDTGELVIALGHAGGYDPVRTPPVRFGRLTSRNPNQFIGTDCALIGGDSGGPLFDLEGRVIGIHSSIGIFLASNNHAGIEGFLQDWEKLKKGETWGSLGGNSPLDDPDAPVIGIISGESRYGGIGIRHVFEGGPASKAGLRAGDIIHKINGRPIINLRKLHLAIAKHKPGDTIQIHIIRNEGMLKHRLKLGRRGDILPDTLGVPVPFEKEALKDQATSFFKASKPAVALAAKSTVSISHGNRRISYGTIVTTTRNPEPAILTKWSEVKNAPSLLVVTTSDGTPLLAKVSGVYPEHDLALLKVNAPEAQLTPLDLAKSASPKLGSFIMLAGPKGDVEGFGVVSVKSRSLRDGDKAYLGVMMDFTSVSRNGVPIKQVVPDSAAHKAGLRKGDVIIAVDQNDITGAMEMRNTLQKLTPGSKIIISYLRAKAQKRTTVRLGSLDDNSTIRRVPKQRMEQMQRMGANPSEVRSDFPSVIQSDMPIQPNDTGAPVTDLNGNMVGIAIARGSRIKTFIIPTRTIREVLATQAIEPDTALTRQAEKNHKLHTGRHLSQPKAASLEEDPIDQVRRLLGKTGHKHDKNE